MQYEVTGIKKFKGDVEGQHHDTTTIYVKTRMDESRGTSKGYATAEYKWGDSSNYEKVAHLKLPMMAELDLEQVTNGKTVKTVCFDLRPVIAPQAAVKAGV